MNPGDLLSYVVREVTGQVAASCGPCRDCITEMNNNGWFWCWTNRSKIEQRLIQAAINQGYSITNESAKGLVVAAFKQFSKFRKTKGKHMKTYTIRTVKSTKSKSTKEAMEHAADAEEEVITISTMVTPEFPITEVSIIDAESFEDAFTRRKEANTFSITFGRQSANLPPPLRSQ
jgi:hypothetical protein